MIQVRGLTKVFPTGTKAVDNLDLDVTDGEILGLLGPNGAGKSTTIRALATLCGFDSGTVKVAGYDVDIDPQRVRQTIGVVAQNTGIDYFLTGRENLELQGQMYRMNKADIRARITELAQYFELADSLDRTVATYSGGMRRKLDIATALIHRPKLVFLDEPTLGLDIKSRKMLWSYIQKLNKEMGITILLTTHYLEEADMLADRVAIISAGKIRAVGTPDELKRAIAGDAITISFEQQDWTTQQFAQALKQAGHVKDLLWQGNKLHLYVENGGESVPTITRLASEKQVRILTLSLSRPSLDDVFLKHTGSSLEGDTEETGDEWWKQWAGKGGGGKWQKQWEQSQAEGQTAESAAGNGEGAQQWSAEETADWQKGQWSAQEMADWQKQKEPAVEPATATSAAAETPQSTSGGWGKWSAEEIAAWQKGQWSAEEMADWQKQKDEPAQATPTPHVSPKK
ncbi:MAG: ATP-binding cassette domain-containing protein [Pseudomonadota bacterium]